MAEQIPYGITQNLLTILGSNLVHEIGLIYGVRGELRKLENTLSTVAAVLLDAEEQEESSHAVAVWVRRLKDVVYDADDLLDDFATEELRRKTDDRGRFAGQTLKLVSCYNLKEWPRNMEKLINLRHLEIDKCDRLSYMPRGLGESTKLQTLPLFRIGSDSWRCRHRRRRIGGLNELKFLNDLRGKLIIEGLVHARSSEAEGAIFEGKQYLECLRLYWGWGGITEDTKKSEEEEAVSVMESLQPHPNLKEFFIQEYGGVRFPNWMMIGGLDLLLPNLVRIEMWFCSRIRVLPPFGQLPSLQYLQLWTLPAAEYMKDYSLLAKPFFPSLKTLKIYNMPNLKEWGMKNVVVKQAPPYSYLEDLQLELIRMELCLSLISVSSSLKSLEIADVEDLISLPQGLRHLSTLQTLSIMACKNLASLPDSIGCLTSLTELKIHLCLRLTSLPKGMRSLRNLHTLEIYSCLYLSERCRKGAGKDWPQISHIPNIIIL